MLYRSGRLAKRRGSRGEPEATRNERGSVRAETKSGSVRRARKRSENVLGLPFEQSDLVQLLERAHVLLERFGRSGEHEERERVESSVGDSGHGLEMTET